MEGEGPERAALRSELEDRIAEGLQHLPEGLCMAVILWDVQGLSGAEAAEALDIEVSTLMTRLHRGRVQLRELLADYLSTK